MSRHLSIALVIPFIFVIFMWMYNYQIVTNETQAFEDFTMRKLANYAADAAVAELLYTGDLDQDYSKDSIVVQPDLALQEFSNIMLIGLGRQTTPSDIEWLTSHHLKTFMVCAYDGMYLYQSEEDYTGDYQFISSPKIPYFYTANDGTQYCLTLGLKKGRWDEITADGYRVLSLDDLPSEITEDIQLTAINNQVSEYLQYAVSRSYGGHLGKSYELPSFASEISGGQPVNNITVIGVLDTNDATTSRPNLLMSIGGARIIQRDPVLGFELNGIKWYAHQSKINGIVPETSVEKQFSSTYDAAKSGYNMYLPVYE